MKHLKTKNVSVFFFLLGVLVSSISGAEIQRYSSGLGREWEFDQTKDSITTRHDESLEIKGFIAENFGVLGSSYEWRERKKVTDATHHHFHYHLYYRSYRVDGIGLSIHYNRKTGIEYASSDLDSPISVSIVPDSPERRARVAGTVARKWARSRGSQIKSWQWEPVLFRGQSSEPFRSSYLITVVPQEKRLATYLLVDAVSGSVLSEFQRIRRARPSTTSVKVFSDSIVSNSTPDLVTITTDSADKLDTTNKIVSVVREEGNGTSGNPFVRKHVTPADYSGVNFKDDPTQYNDVCTGIDFDCANQAFDAVNVFYHLQQYRDGGIKAYLINLGLTLANDPLFVVVNSKFISFGNGFDNAGFVDQSCGDGPNMDRCLVFLPPSRTTVSITGCSGAQTLNNMAREGFVVVHEYQHYITDQFSGIEVSASGQNNVGDIIHEGYSDYAAASQLSSVNNKNITEGLVSFPTCSGIRRDVANLLAYQETDAFAEPHYAGLSWASALWRLHEEFGKADADQLMLKSLTFLGANPGFVSSVESLVKADKALTGGIRVDRIRQLLYSEVKFLGSSQGAFKNPATLETYVGFKGCSSVAFESSGNSYPYSILCLLAWALVTLKAGRVVKKRIAL
jgi:hypothetical protein